MTDAEAHRPIALALIARVGAHEPLLAAGARELRRATRHDTPFGASNPVHLLEWQGLPFAVLSRHGEQGYAVAAPWVNDRANLYALKDLGVERILSWSSPGSLVPAVGAGDLLLPDDVLDERRAPPFSFFEGLGIGVIRMQSPFCPSLRQAFRRTLDAIGQPYHAEGVYVGTQGPRLETPAEIRKLRAAGGTVVGMTVVPEVFLARELEMCYGAVCLVVNHAEGIDERVYEPGILFEGLATSEELDRVRRAEERFAEIALPLLRSAADSDGAAGDNEHEHPPPAATTPCHCRRALERYRQRGDIGADWKHWWDR